jgi:hypothetical protein
VFKFRSLGRAAAVCLSLIAVSHDCRLQAENGRNFAGSYQIQAVRVDGPLVTFHLYLKLVNYSGSDITDANVTITARGLPPGSPDPDFSGEVDHVTVKYRKLITLGGDFTIPESEYQQWQKGATPNVVVTYLNADGDQIQNTVELSKVQ